MQIKDAVCSSAPCMWTFLAAGVRSCDVLRIAIGAGPSFRSSHFGHPYSHLRRALGGQAALG